MPYSVDATRTQRTEAQDNRDMLLEEVTILIFEGLLPESQGQNMDLTVLHVALTVLYVPMTILYVAVTVLYEAWTVLDVALTVLYVPNSVDATRTQRTEAQDNRDMLLEGVYCLICAIFGGHDALTVLYVPY
jgi:hypothetical protein